MDSNRPLPSCHRSFTLQRESNSTSSGFVYLTQLAAGDGITCALSVCQEILANRFINVLSYTFYNSRFVAARCLFSYFSLAVQTKIRTFQISCIHFSDDAPSHSERERKMAGTSLMILILFGASFFPFFIQICIYLDSRPYRKFSVVVHIFLYLSSLNDPFMYTWRVPKFRRSLREWLKFKKR